MVGRANQEVSTIKPVLSGEKSKAVPKFHYSTAEYDSYIKNGFGAPDLVSRSDKFEQRFLAQVDLEKCPHKKIQVRILNMIRTKAVDYSTEKEERKEYLVYMCDWLGNNWLGNELAVRGHVEGKFQELTRRLITNIDKETGETQGYYVKGPMREIGYYSLQQESS